MTDPLRLACGTLTALPVPPPRRVDDTVTARAMLLAPLVGLGLGVVTEAVVLVVRLGFAEPANYVVAALVALSVLALLTGGRSLAGLAATADRVAGRREGSAGAVALVLVLLLDAAGLALAISTGRGTLALVGGAAVARLAVAWTARAGLPALRTGQLLALSALVGVVLGAMTVLDDDLTVRFVPHTLTAAAVALGVSRLVVAAATRRAAGAPDPAVGAASEVCFCVFLLGVAAG